MKKLLFVATLVGISGLVHATTINAPSSLIGTSVLNGNNAYSWGISIAVPSGQSVVSAQIDFTGIVLTAGNGTGTDYLYTDLLNSTMTGTGGVTTRTDGDAAGDYWAIQFSGGNIANLGSRLFSTVNGTPQSWSYAITGSALTALQTYLAAGTFNIGIDPDCRFTVGGLSFTYSLSPGAPTVPDGTTTALLMVLGLAGLELFRRQFVLARCKA